MGIRHFKKDADPHIDPQIAAQARGLIETMLPDDLGMFDELFSNQAWGGLRVQLVAALGVYGDRPTQYPDVTRAQKAGAQRLANQLQFTGRYI